MAVPLEAARNLVEQVHLLATSSSFGSVEDNRGVVRSSRGLTPNVVLQLREGMGHEELPYVRGLSQLERGSSS